MKHFMLTCVMKYLHANLRNEILHANWSYVTGGSRSSVYLVMILPGGQKCFSEKLFCSSPRPATALQFHSAVAVVVQIVIAHCDLLTSR